AVAVSAPHPSRSTAGATCAASPAPGRTGRRCSTRRAAAILVGAIRPATGGRGEAETTMATTRAGAGAVHLVGSVPLADAESVFRTVTSALGPHLRRLPDGETGERRRWIYFQRLMLERHEAMEPDPTVPLFALRQWDGKLLRETPLLRFRAGVEPDRVAFETGYGTAARASYDVLQALRRQGAIPAGLRLQLCLPTPIASAFMYAIAAVRP